VGDAAGGVDARRTAVTTTPSATEARDASLLKTEPAYGRFRFARKNNFPLSLKLSGMRTKVGAATCRHEHKGRGMAAQAVGRAAKLQLHISDCAANRSVDAKQAGAASARGSHHHAARADGVLGT
jgi:hypothetical protein